LSAAARLPRLLAAALALAGAARAQGPDVRVNDPAQDGGGVTQSEVALARDGDVICVGWRDFAGGRRLNGFGVSRDGGETFRDRGLLSSSLGVFADPVLVAIPGGGFWYASLESALTGVILHHSRDCESFAYVGHVTSRQPKSSIDKPWLARDPRSGRLYAAYVRLGQIVVAESDDPAREPDAGWAHERVLAPGSGPWLDVAPDGTAFVAFGAVASIRLFARAEGGSWEERTPIARIVHAPMYGPASRECRRPALNGKIRVELLPQLAIQPDAGAPAGYALHAVWNADTDGDAADASDVLYARSLDGGRQWSQARRLNDDETKTDQWNPALGAGAEGVVAVSFYDRRLDPERNWKFDRYLVVSRDGGASWGSNLRVSDQSSPVSPTHPHVDPHSASCYHGDYDQVVVGGGAIHMVWSDDRRLDPPCPKRGTDPAYLKSCPNPDVYYDRVELAAPPPAR
jgi:hypothetical protein